MEVRVRRRLGIILGYLVFNFKSILVFFGEIVLFLFFLKIVKGVKFFLFYFHFSIVGIGTWFFFG